MSRAVAARAWAKLSRIEKNAIDDAAHDAATSPFNADNPSDEQKSAGNYRKGHIVVGGLDIAIENPAGSHRKPEWPALASHYGYIKRTEGADGDHVDVFVRQGISPDYSGPVFVIDQCKPDGTFDEHKCMLGWPNKKSARAAYLENYTSDWKCGPITRYSLAEFKIWLTTDTTTPAAKLAKAREMSEDELQNFLDDVLSDADWAEFSDTLEEASKAAYKRAANLELTAAGQLTEDNINLLDQYAAEWAGEYSAKLVTSIDNSTRENLRGLIQDAVKEGWHESELSKEIQNAYAFSPQRADTIATTELAQAHTHGRIAVAEEAGATHKRSLLSADHDDHLSCFCAQAADAGVVPIEELFVRGETDSDFPPYHPNCQCDWVGVYPDDEEAQKLAKEWIEEDHPRDEDGKFTEAGSGGTSRERPPDRVLTLEDRRRFDAEARKQKEKINAVNEDAAFALQEYTGSAAFSINRYLSGNFVENQSAYYGHTELVSKLANDMHAAFEHASEAEPGIYYRGIRASNSSKLTALKPGDEFMSKTFVSTTENLEVAKGFTYNEDLNERTSSIVQEIIVHPDARPPRLYGNEYEYEHILPVGTRFRVVEDRTVDEYRGLKGPVRVQTVEVVKK